MDFDMDTLQHNEQLFDAFVFDIHDALATFASATEELGHDYNLESLKELGMISHRIKGTAALYNYPQVSKLAEIIERLMEHSERIPESQLPTLLDFLERVMVCFRGGLEGITERGDEGDIGLQLTSLGAAKLFKEILRAAPEAFLREREATLQTGYVQSSDIIHDVRAFHAVNSDSWEFFAPEASEHLEMIASTLEATRDGATPEHITQLFRSTHTIKGAAYMIDFKPMGDLAHRLEDIMVAVREGGKPFDAEVHHALSEGRHVLRSMLATAEGQDTDLAQHLGQVKQQLAKLLGQEMAEGSSDISPSDSSDPSDAAPSSDDFASSLHQFKLEHQDVWDYFAPEVQDNLTDMQRGLEAARQGDSSEDIMATLFRTGHTIKGAAYTVNFNALGDLAKEVESISRALRESNEFEYAEVADAMQAGHEALTQMMHAANGEEHQLNSALKTFRDLYVPLGLGEEVVTQVQATKQGNRTITDTRTTTIRVSLDKIDRLMNLAGEMVISRAKLEGQLGHFSEIGEVLEASRKRMVRTTAEFEEKYLNPRLRDMSQAVTPQNSEQRSGLKNSINEMFDELELDTYSDLNILARTVSEMTNDLSEVQGQLSRFTRALAQEVEVIQRLSRSLRNEVSRTRLVPVGQLYNRLRRLVKQSDLNKFYALETSGEAVEMDAAILEDITDPMLHLVKNAIAHGIENRDQRTAKGKDEAGTITLRAYPQGNYIFVEVQDDGAGIDVESVKAKAVEKGLRSPSEVSKLSDEEAINLIFLPGLSTAKEVTTDAGRGVGMDAVASNIRKLGGEIGISTDFGRGTRFTLKLPLTLLVSEAMMVTSGAQTFAFPINTVRTLRYIAADQLTGHEVNVGDQMLPLYHLHELLHLPLEAQGFERAVAVLETGSGQIAVSVDDFTQIEEVVIKSLGETLQKLGYLSGATLSSRGEVILLLDPAGLVKLAQQGTRSEVSYRPVVATTTAQQTLRLLLVDDSVSVRKVVSKMLHRAGYDVTTANDGQDALEILREKRFDAVLTDLEMPRLNGYELIEDVRRRLSREQLPIVVMTTRAGEKHMNLALELGANNYFTKPIDETKLLNFLRSLQRQDASLFR
jgi:chemosensory pili system protein ChpA (sensor histidine kinase/response regulator)